MDASILHADLDAFYASVEQLLQPALRGRPVAVGGGVVLAASYEARAFGVRSGMTGRRGRELCPELIFTGGHFSEYQRLGDAAIAVLADYTPDIERISIDEAFADVSASRRLFGAPAAIAKRVRARVRAELGLPISIGVARTKHLAKIASQVAKPDGLVLVDPAAELAFLHDLPVELMWGRPGDEASPGGRRHPDDRPTGAELAGVGGAPAGPRCRPQAAGAGLEPRPANDPSAPGPLGWRPVGAGRRPARSSCSARPAASGGPHRQASARQGPALFEPVTVRVRFADLRSVTRALTLPAPISATTALMEVAVDLVRGVLADHPGERTISRCRRSRAPTLARMRFRNSSCRFAWRTTSSRPRHAQRHGATAGGPGHGRDPRPLRHGGG